MDYYITQSKSTRKLKIHASLIITSPNMSLIPIVSTFSEAGRSLIEVSWKGDGKEFVEFSPGETSFDSGGFCLVFGLTWGGVTSVSSSVKTNWPVERDFFLPPLVLFSLLDSVLAEIPLLATVVEVERAALEELLLPRVGGDISRSRDARPVYMGSAFFCRLNGGPGVSGTVLRPVGWSGGRMALLALLGRGLSSSCRRQ